MFPLLGCLAVLFSPCHRIGGQCISRPEMALWGKHAWVCHGAGNITSATFSASSNPTEQFSLLTCITVRVGSDLWSTTIATRTHKPSSSLQLAHTFNHGHYSWMSAAHRITFVRYPVLQMVVQGKGLQVWWFWTKISNVTFLRAAFFPPSPLSTLYFFSSFSLPSSVFLLSLGSVLPDLI